MRERFQVWWDTTRSCRWELVRHFFVRLFDSDLIRSRGQLAVFAVGVLIALLMASAFLPLQLIRKYTDLVYLSTGEVNALVITGDRLFFLCIGMVLAGFLGAFQWQSLFPERQDYLILGPLPVRARDIFAGKFISLILFVTLFALAWCLPSSFFLPLVQNNKWSVPGLGLPHMGAHFAASWMGVWLVFFGLMALQGIGMALLPERAFRRLSLFSQVVLMAALLSALPLLTWIPGLYQHMAERPAWGLWAPPLWILGFEEWLVGRREPYVEILAARAAIATLAALSVTLLAYLLTYRRHTKNAAESVPRLRRSRLLERWWDTLASLWIRDTRELAAWSFLWKTLLRSRWHKVLLGAFLGLACAFALDTVVELMLQKSFHGFGSRSLQLERAALSLPLVFIFFLVLGLRYIYSIPVEPGANWIFRIHEEPPLRFRLLSCARRGYFWIGILPVLLLTLPIEIMILGPGSAFLQALSTLLVSLCLVEWLLWKQDKVPFTCSWLPGQGNVAMKAALTWIAFSMFACTVTPALILLALSDPAALLMLFGTLLAGYAKLRQYRLAIEGEEPLQFESEPEPAVRQLGLAGSSLT